MPDIDLGTGKSVVPERAVFKVLPDWWGKTDKQTVMRPGFLGQGKYPTRPERVSLGRLLPWEETHLPPGGRGRRINL